MGLNPCHHEVRFCGRAIVKVMLELNLKTIHGCAVGLPDSICHAFARRVMPSPETYVCPYDRFNVHGRDVRLNFFRPTRFHHITTPVTNMAAGVSPARAQTSLIVWSQSPGPWQGIPIPLMRPKCRYASQ